MDYSILKDTGVYKDKLIAAFLASDEICELLLNRNTYTAEDVSNLMYTQVFPYLYSEKAQTEILPYLCVEADISAVPTNTVKNMQITIWAYCHINCMQYSKEGYSGTRVDILADLAEQILRETNQPGIGKLQLQSSTYFIPNDKYYGANDKYYGKQLIFSIPAFKISR